VTIRFFLSINAVLEGAVDKKNIDDLKDMLVVTSVS